NDLTMSGGSLEVLDQAPPPGEDPVLNRSLVGGYLRDGAMTMNGGTVTTPNLKVGVTPGKVGTLTMNGGVIATQNLLAANGAGSASLGGTLHVKFAGNRLPAPGQQFAVVIGHPRSGTFASVQGAGGTVSYTDTSVVVTFTGVDVPPAVEPLVQALALRPIQPN